MRKLLFAAIALFAAACTTDTTQDLAINIPQTLSVSLEENSRIQLQDGKTVWTEGDFVSVFYRSNANSKWQFQGQTGDRTGELKQISSANSTQELSKVVVVYPYSEKYYINPETCDVEAYLPATQHYLEDSYGLDGNILISAGYYSQFSLKNVCGWLKVQLTGNGEAVQSITLKGNHGEQVAGQVYINSADATATLASEMGKADDGENSTGGNLVFEDTVINTVTLNCGEGVTLGAEPTAFYIALPPQTFTKGLTIDITTVDGAKMSKSTSNEITIERNTIQPMTAIEYDGVTPEQCELAYTTNNGERLTPYNTDDFGANLVKNIYDATTGKGTLKFDGKITAIAYNAFRSCSNLTSITIPNSVTSVGRWAFRSCNNLTSVTLGNGVTDIKMAAFYGCTGLKSINIPNSVTSIGDKAFYNCKAITTITIPSSVTSIGTSSFEGCGGIATINCKIESKSSSSEGKFYKAQFTNVIIGNGVTEIGEMAFYYCDKLATVTIPDSATTIGVCAFEYCSSLTSVELGNGVTKIDGYAFENCSKLSSITIPESVTKIGSLAFNNCSSLTAVYCQATTPPTLGSGAFDNNASDRKIYIPHGTINAYKYAANWINYADAIMYRNDIIFYTTTDGKLLAPYSDVGFGASIQSNTYENGQGVLTFNGDVRCFANYAFYNCTRLSSITIPDSVTRIEYNVFAYCSLTEVTIPAKVKVVGERAFNDCKNLKVVYCKATTPPQGGQWMFSGSSRKIYVPRASVEAYKTADYWDSYADSIEPYDFVD